MTLRGRWLALAAAVVFSSCVGGRDLSHYVALIDELSVPANWELVRETISEPGGENGCSRLNPGCPSITRVYLADEKPVAVFPIAQEILTSADLEIEQAIAPTCDAPPSGAACFVVGGRDSDSVRISIFNPGAEQGGHGIADPTRSLVVVTADGGV